MRAAAPIVDAGPWAEAAGAAVDSAAMATSAAIRRGTERTLVAYDDVPYRPERLLDVYRRHSGHRHGEQDHLAGALRDPGVRRDVAEQHRERAPRAGHDEPSRRDLLARCRDAQPQGALD